jgi:hypothetical protein
VEKVKIGTCLKLRGVELAEVALRHSQSWIAETPAVKDGKPSITKLPLWSTIRDRDDTTSLEIVQSNLAPLPGRLLNYGAPHRCMGCAQNAATTNDGGPHLGMACTIVPLTHR